MPGSIIFAGCARDCAAHLPQVLANFERLASTVESACFILAEDGSSDSTRDALSQWCGERGNAHILNFDDLDAMPKRPSERQAVLRNRILAFIKDRGLTDYDGFCIMDFGAANAPEIATDGFAAATEFLFSHRANAGVFAVSDPVYYDIDALRCEGWCAADWRAAFRATPVSGKSDAFQALVCDRQVPVDRAHPPIYVSSAFGGLAVYRLSYALQAAYAGLDQDGEETCEHVSFNADIKRLGGDLYIFPALRNSTPWQACFEGQQQKTMRLSNNGVEIELLAPQSHQLDHYMNAYPLYDRRLSLLLAVFNRLAGPASLLDIGANILDTVALIRLNGVQLSRSVSVDASLEFYKYARFNAARNAAQFGKSEIIWGFVGAEEDWGNIAAGNGTGNVRNLRSSGEGEPLLNPRHVTFADLARTGADLVKIDLDGYDHVVIRKNMAWLKRWKPMLWVEAQIEAAADLSAWSNILLALADDFPYVAAFDNFGFCLCAGTMIEKWSVVLELIGIGARYRMNEATLGKPGFYYLDLLFVPRHRAPVFQAFVAQLPEMQLAGGNAAPEATPESAEAREYHAHIG
ncbi:MAG TPA: hypothetical protein VIJ06_02065 [Methylovirgula sp.]